jgi:hypothetical protein
VESENVTYTEETITSDYDYHTTQVEMRGGKNIVRPVTERFTFKTERKVLPARPHQPLDPHPQARRALRALSADRVTSLACARPGAQARDHVRGVGRKQRDDCHREYHRQPAKAVMGDEGKNNTVQLLRLIDPGLARPTPYSPRISHYRTFPFQFLCPLSLPAAPDIFAAVTGLTTPPPTTPSAARLSVTARRFPLDRPQL